MCERFFCTPAQVRPLFCAKLPLIPLRSFSFAQEVPTSARTSPADEPITRSFSRRTPAHSRSVPSTSHAKFPPLLAHPRRRAENSLILAPNSHLRARSSPIRRHAKFSPPLAHPSLTSQKHAHSRSELPLSRPEPPSVGTHLPGAKAKPLIGTTRAPRRRPHLHRTRHKNAPTLPRLGEKT